MTNTQVSGQAVFADLAANLGVRELVPLAQGGQKFVLRALRDGQPVAVKVILVPPGGPEHAVALTKARRETRVLAAVDTPRVVRLVADVRELTYNGTLPYGVAWVEELLDGEDLDTLLGSPWAAPDAARLLVHLAEALAALHANGIVHRDLAPVNVRRRGDGGYCLMDPGLAWFPAEGDPGDADRIGTRGYLSPEHVPGGVVGPPSDVYCLGILIFQALAGTLPSPDLSLPPGTPSGLADIVERCLSPDPADRFADGAALMDALSEHPELFSAAVPAPPTPIDPPTDPLDLAYAACGDELVELRGAFGTRGVDVESIAKDQEPFAIRLSPRQLEVAPAVTFSARTIELGHGRFANSYELTVDTRRAAIGVRSSTSGFHLPDLFDASTIAAVNGSFSFISDDFEYEPAEFCLDFCARDGQIVSLPTVPKPALITGHDGVPQLRELDARGTLRIGSRQHRWIGSKLPTLPPDDGSLVVFGPANCRVQYTEAPRVGVLRGVDRATNRTPAISKDVLDLVVVHDGSRHIIKALFPGGNADLFEGSFILRGSTDALAEARPGDEVEITTVDGVNSTEIESGFSIGPTVAAAAQGDALPGYDDSLGLSPFLPGARYARTLISLTDDVLRLQVLDGAPLTRNFQGVSCSEAAHLVVEDGLDPRHVYHLDGGQSAKLAFHHLDETVVRGSMHYLLWPKQDHGAFLWRGAQGRLLRSALTVSRVRARIAL